MPKLLKFNHKEYIVMSNTKIDAVKHGARVSRYRKSAGLSLEQMAKKVGITKGNIVKIESGVQFPKCANFVAICNSLNVSPDFILQDNGKMAALLAAEEYCRLLNFASSTTAIQSLNTLLEKRGSHV